MEKPSIPTPPKQRLLLLLNKQRQFSTDRGSGLIIHRVYHPNAGKRKDTAASAHHCTLKDQEKDYLTSQGWSWENNDSALIYAKASVNRSIYSPLLFCSILSRFCQIQSCRKQSPAFEPKAAPDRPCAWLCFFMNQDCAVCVLIVKDRLFILVLQTAL